MADPCLKSKACDLEKFPVSACDCDARFGFDASVLPGLGSWWPTIGVTLRRPSAMLVESALANVTIPTVVLTVDNCRLIHVFCTATFLRTAVEKKYKTNRHSYSIAAANRIMAAGAPAARVRARVAHFALASDLTLALICTQLCQTHSVNTATSEASTETNAGHARSQCHDWDHRTNRETRLELAGRQVLHACLCNRGYSYEAGNDQG